MGITGLFRRLGEILVRERLTTPDVVEQALVRARTTGERVGEALVSARRREGRRRAPGPRAAAEPRLSQPR